MTTEGKILGRIAFIVSELVLVLLCIIWIIGVILGFELNMSGATILTFQGTIFVTVWGAKAAKNFVPQQKKDDE